MRLRLGASESLNEDVFGSIWVFPKIGGFYPPKCMVKIMENPIKWMIWGYHYFWKHLYSCVFAFGPRLFNTEKIAQDFRDFMTKRTVASKELTVVEYGGDRLTGPVAGQPGSGLIPPPRLAGWTVRPVGRPEG